MRCIAVLAAALALGGCANFNVPPGASRETLVQRLGQPQRVVRLPDGERLQYSLQPAGQYAWMIDVDAQGRVVRSRQVLNELDFHRIQLGQWTRDDVEREFGRPASVDHVASWDGPIMTYRWKAADQNMFYWVYLDRGNVVRRAHPGMEPTPEPIERFL